MDRLADLLLHTFQIVWSCLISKRPLTHDVGPQGGVAHIGAIVDALRQALNGIQIFWERFPGPFDTGIHGLRRDVFSPFQVAHDHVFFALFTRRERKATVTHDHTGDTMPTRAGTEWVPRHLGVHMRMAVDKTWCHNVPFGINNFLGTFSPNPANRSDLAINNSHVSPKARHSRAVYHRSILNNQIVLHSASFSFSGV